MRHLLQYFFLLFLIPVSSTIPTISFTTIPAVHSLCTKDQQLSLLHLKQSLTPYNHKPYPRLYSTKVMYWDSRTDCCFWDGVTCSSGRVVGLDFSGETINTGIGYRSPIPSAIGNLTSLRYLDLSNSNFTGSIPKTMGNLKQLVYLNLSSNMLNGPIDSIQWENLVNLIDLRLYNNLLEGSIPSSIFALPLLQFLLFSHNQFSGQLHEFSDASSSYLLSLDLSSNNLEGLISSSIFNFHALESLNLSSNNFSAFPFNGPQQLKNLNEIDLSYNSLLFFYNGTTSSYSSFPNIVRLNLTSNKLRTIPDFLRYQSGLVKLDLSQNQIQGMIPKWIWGLDLFSLNLSCNSFSGHVPNFTTSVVDLHSNQLQGPLPSLTAEFMDYSRNHFSSSIPTGIDDSLYFLSLSSNNLHGIIPTSICNPRFLQVLDLSNNSLSGMIPRCLSAKESLGVLNLRGNNLTGRVSNLEFPGWCSLSTLDLGENQIKGEFPKSLANCSGLQLLNLGNNLIKDAFPCLLMNLPLHVLNLRSNQFYGGIGCPNTNGTWPMLQIIDLAHNNLSGQILARFFMTWKSMMADSREKAKVLEFSQEQEGEFGVGYSFEDTVKVTSKGSERVLVKVLTAYTLIDFSCNKFSGSIPKEMGAFKSLYVLNLSGNAFTGKIPSSFGNMRPVADAGIATHLSHNKLSGQIPPQLVKLTFLEVLDLSNNQLVGRIPTGTQFSTFPKDSFIGNKGLWGPPLTVDNKAGLPPPPTVNGRPPNSGHHHEVNWDLISTEIGFTFGFGVSIGSLVLCKRLSKWYYRAMYNIILKIFPQLEERIGIHRRHVHINRRWRR
ncbi:unnamed protein product [Prunus brigantina]